MLTFWLRAFILYTFFTLIFFLLCFHGIKYLSQNKSIVNAEL